MGNAEMSDLGRIQSETEADGIMANLAPGKVASYDHDPLGAMEAERDRYRAALERIYKSGYDEHVEIAREALNNA